MLMKPQPLRGEPYIPHKAQSLSVTKMFCPYSNIYMVKAEQAQKRAREAREAKEMKLKKENPSLQGEKKWKTKEVAFGFGAQKTGGQKKE